MSENSIAALVSILTYRRKKDSKPAGRRMSKYEEHGDGRVSILRVIKGETPEMKEKPLVLSFELCADAHVHYRKGDVLQVEGVIEPLTKKEDILYVSRSCVPTEAGEKALSFKYGENAQDKRNELVESGEGFMIADKPSVLPDVVRQDILALHEFLYKHGFCFDIEMSYFIDAYFKRRVRNRKTSDNVADFVRRNPLVLSELYCIEPKFSPSNLIKSFRLQPTEEALVYAKAVSFLNLFAFSGDTFVPMSKLYGLLSDDLRGKPKDFLSGVLMSKNDAFIQTMAKINFCSGKKMFQGSGSEAEAYFEKKLEEERPGDEKNQRAAHSCFFSPAFYLTKNFFGERSSAERFAARLAPAGDCHFAISIDKRFTPAQKAAVERAFLYLTSVITGSAGCGKTAVISEIVRIASKNKKSVVVLAPSAKAALHAAVEIRNSSGDEELAVPYQTIHRFAKILPEDSDAGESGDFLPVDNVSCPDFVIIDEMSMCELSVFSRVMRVLEKHPTAHLVLVGDPMQLPAIGPQFFHQIADGVIGDVLPVTNLTKNFRAENDGLAKFGESVRKGSLLSGNSCVHYEDTNIETFMVKHESLVADPDVMFLATRKSDVLRLNNAIRKVRHPDAVPINGTMFYLGDRVVTTQNDYVDKKDVPVNRHKERSIDVYNGTDGIIESFDEASDTVSVRMFSPGLPLEGTLVPYRRKELSVYLIPAFAETVHKAQGSQFDRVVFFLPQTQRRGVSRNLVYTAITRAKKEVWLVGSGDGFADAVSHMSHAGNSFFAFRVRNQLASKGKEEEKPVFSV